MRRRPQIDTTGCPPPPIDASLPLPDSDRYPGAKSGRNTFDGPLMYRILNRSKETLVGVWGVVILVPGLAGIGSVACDDA